MTSKGEAKILPNFSGWPWPTHVVVPTHVVILSEAKNLMSPSETTCAGDPAVR